MQIGPRIRVGGSVGKFGESLKKGAGAVLSNPIVQTVGSGLLAATGVGAPLAAGIMAGSGALGGALQNRGVGGALKGAAGGAIAGYGGAKLGLGIKGALGIGQAPSAVDGFGFGGSTAGKLLGGVKTAMGMGGGGMGGAGGWLPTAIQTAGGLAGGALDARQEAATLAERQREFDLQQQLAQNEFGLKKGQVDYQMANDKANAPMKLAVIQALMGRLQQSPASMGRRV